MGLMMIVGILRYIEVQKRDNDPNWQIAKEIYKVENALKELDDDYECQSVAKVTPLTYTDSEGNTIFYYCIQTVYLENESGAFLCELGDRSYLCWTLSPDLSCVIEYSAEAISEESIFQIAESVPVS